MLRGICLALGFGCVLVACSGDGKQGQAPTTTEPGACQDPCSADQVCGGGECRAACNRDKDCNTGQACRDGGCYDVACGDEVVEGDEECDNGERNQDDASCTSACLKAVCGDGLIRAGREDCDDGPDNADDGACTSECQQARCGDGLVWTGHEECDDGANNAVDAACTPDCTRPQNLGPDAATELSWKQGGYTNSTTPVAIWKPSSSMKAVAQAVQVFSDGSCKQAIGDPVPLPASTTAMLTVPVAGEGTYSFQIITRDSEAREVTSECSAALVVDTTPPEPATDLGFVESSPHESLIVHGTWTRSASPDLGAQAIQLYGGGVCASASGAPVDVGSATAAQSPIVTPSAATFSFKVISTDWAGNSAVSGCSTAMQTAGGKPYTAKFNGELPQSVVQTRIDPKNPATLYVTLLSGEVRKSDDNGLNWTLQCKSSNIAAYGGNYGHIVVSPDGTAYATGHTQFVRVEALNGAECPTIIGGSAAWASYYHSNRLAIDSTGKLYTWGFTGPAGLVSSSNKGTSYDVINTTASLFNSLEVDPFDDKHLVGVFGSHDSDPVGVFHSLDAGAKWTQTDVAFEQYQGGIRFNPAVKGWIYLAGGRYSKDGGVSWATDANFDCLEVDSNGAGYRLVAAGGDTQLQKAPDMTKPAWSTLYTFSGVKANLGVSMVSVVGGSIAVVLEGRLFVSTNSGGSFNPIKLAVKDGTLVASSIVAHGSLVYAAAGGHIFKSTNAGVLWSDVYAPATPLDSDTELHLNPGVTEQLVARPESWNSTYDERVDVTLDGGASWSTSSDCCYGWSGVLGLGATDASRIFYFGWHPRFSSDGGLSFMESSSSGQLVWDPWPAAFVSPASNNLAFYGDDSGRFYQYDLTAKSDTNVTSRLPFADPAGIDLVKLGNAWQLRIISRTGQVAISNDNGATFAAVAGSGGLPSVTRRIFVSHPDTPGLIATAPLLGGDIAYSPTLGASWVKTTLDSCEIRSLALTDGQILIACDGKAALGVAAP